MCEIRHFKVVQLIGLIYKRKIDLEKIPSKKGYSYNFNFW